jgi:4-hydroxybenzoate polyprenyltransferase
MRDNGQKELHGKIEGLVRSFTDEIVEFLQSIPGIGKSIPLLSLISMSRPTIIAVVVLTPAASAFLATNGFPPFKESALGVLCLVLAIASAHIYNDVCDEKVDRINRRTQNRPLVLGLISRRTALVTSIVLSVLSLAVAFIINFTCAILLAIGILLIFSYSKKLKRTKAGFLPPALAAFFIPFGAFAAYSQKGVFSLPPLIIGLSGFFFELVPYWSQTLPDTEGDRKRGLKTLAVCVGPRKTALSIFASFLICLLFLFILHRITILSTVYLLFISIGGAVLSLFMVWFTFKPTPRNAFIVYFLSLIFIGLVSVIIIGETVFSQRAAYLHSLEKTLSILKGKLL